jgi:solute:Na+ symporter, SSS family
LMKHKLSGFMLYMAEINFLHFAIILFAICVIVLIVVSLASERPDPETLKDITYTRDQSDGIMSKSTFWLSVFLGVIILALWFYLS